MRYEVNTDIYEGPLSLLVELAKLNLLDLFIVKLQELTAAYLAFVKVSRHDLDVLAEPLPLLGQLAAVKARMLLPKPPEPEEEEEPVSLEELERRLREYEQFKTVAQLLAELHALQHQHFTGARRLPSTGSDDQTHDAAPIEVGIVDLMTAFAKVLEQAAAPIMELATELWTVEMKVRELVLLLTTRRQVRFFELFDPTKTKLELVVTFLALLELVRQCKAQAVQERHFGEILILRRDPQTAGAVQAPVSG